MAKVAEDYFEGAARKTEATSSAKAPFIELVTVQEPGFCTPRITIHM
jgi:hypothetical protein